MCLFSTACFRYYGSQVLNFIRYFISKTVIVYQEFHSTWTLNGGMITPTERNEFVWRWLWISLRLDISVRYGKVKIIIFERKREGEWRRGKACLSVCLSSKWLKRRNLSPCIEQLPMKWMISRRKADDSTEATNSCHGMEYLSTVFYFLLLTLSYGVAISIFLYVSLSLFITI